MRKTIIALIMFGMTGVLAEASPIIKVDDPIWNVGIITTGSESRKSVRISNAGDQPLVIEKVDLCCGFSGGLPEGTRLLPGESVELQLFVSTFKMIGELNAEIFLLSNDPEHPRFSIFALGKVVPKVYALAELQAVEADLGVVDLRDSVPFRIGIRNPGNDLLRIRRVEKGADVVDVGTIAEVAAGAEASLTFEFRPKKAGPIDEQVVITTNDALNRTLAFRLRGYATQEHLPTQALAVYPVGKQISWDVMSRSFTYGFSVANASAHDIEVTHVESSLPVEKMKVVKKIAAGQLAQEEIAFALQLNEVPIKGYVYITLALPVEVR